MAIDKHGRKIGGAIHQFRDTDEGLQGILCVDFPARAPRTLMEGHRIHLAIEFANWIEAAARDLHK